MSSQTPITISDTDAMTAPNNIGDMSIDEISRALDGKIGLGPAKWSIITVMFLVAIVLAIIAFVVVWYVFSKQLSLENGGKNYTIVRLTASNSGTATNPVIIEHSTSYIYSVTNVNKTPPPDGSDATVNSISLYVHAPATSIPGAEITFVSNVTYGSNNQNITTATLNVVSPTGSNNSILFTYLDGTTGTSVNVINNLALIYAESKGISTSIPAGSYTVSRNFIWQSTNKLIEVDMSDGFQPFLLT